MCGRVRCNIGAEPGAGGRTWRISPPPYWLYSASTCSLRNCEERSERGAGSARTPVQGGALLSPAVLHCTTPHRAHAGTRILQARGMAASARPASTAKQGSTSSRQHTRWRWRWRARGWCESAACGREQAHSARSWSSFFLSSSLVTPDSVASISSSLTVHARALHVRVRADAPRAGGTAARRRAGAAAAAARAERNARQRHVHLLQRDIDRALHVVVILGGAESAHGASDDTRGLCWCERERRAADARARGGRRTGPGTRAPFALQWCARGARPAR